MEVSQAGNDNYNAASTTVTFTVIGQTKQDQTITMEAIDTQDLSVSTSVAVVVSTSSGLNVTLAVSGPATINGTTITLTGVGTVTVTASQAGNDNYNAAQDVSVSFEVIDNTVTCDAFAVELTESVDNMCFGETSGSIDIMVSGGSENYSHSWSNGATTEDISGLAAGTYTVTVTDLDAGCEATLDVTITEPASALVITSTTSDVQLGNDGAADVTVTGGTEPYTYSWSDGSTNEDLSDVAMGEYSLTVTDANGCTKFETVFVEDIITGTEDQLSTKLSYFPNPIENELIVNLSQEVSTDISLQIVDLSGRVLIQEEYAKQQLNNRVLNLSDLESGQYLLKVFTSDNQWVERIIKK